MTWSAGSGGNLTTTRPVTQELHKVMKYLLANQTGNVDNKAIQLETGHLLADHADDDVDRIRDNSDFGRECDGFSTYAAVQKCSNVRLGLWHELQTCVSWCCRHYCWDGRCEIPVLVDRRRYSSPTQLLVAALEHSPQGGFEGREHDEATMAKVWFHALGDKHRSAGKFSFNSLWY